MDRLMIDLETIIALAFKTSIVNLMLMSYI